MNEWRRLVRRDPFCDSRSPCEPFHGPVRCVAVRASSVESEEDRPDDTFTGVQIECATGPWGERGRDVLVALAHDPQCAVPTVGVQIGDVGTGRLGDP